MTIVYEPSRASELSTSDESNNPIVFWNNKIATYTAPNGTETGFPVANLQDPSTAKFCQPTVSSGEYIVEFTVADDVSIIAIAAHNLGTVGATVRIQHFTGGSWSDAGAGVVSPTDNQAILWRITATTESNWRVLIAGSPSAQPAFAVLYAGEETIFPQRIYQDYMPAIVQTNVRQESNVTEGGHFLGSASVKSGSSASGSITHLTPAFIRGSDFVGFMNHFNETRPFFWAWRPTKYGDAYYSWRDGAQIWPTNSGPKDYMSISMAMRLYDDT